LFVFSFFIDGEGALAIDPNVPIARAYQTWFEYLDTTEDGKLADTQFTGEALFKLIALKDRYVLFV
jgi:hypothetical protein